VVLARRLVPSPLLKRLPIFPGCGSTFAPRRRRVEAGSFKKEIRLAASARRTSSALGVDFVPRARRSFSSRVEGEGANYTVTVPLGGGDGQIIAVLNAIEQYVADRNDGPALLDLEGRSYRLQPTPGS
jgi:hypothetical protein